jgi:RNA polymerase sigma-70 factor, ECF subfamily
MASSLVWTLPGTAAAASPRSWSETLRQDASPVTDGGTDRTAGLALLGEVELVAACLDAHPGAFDLIVERHQRPLYQLCYRFVGNREDASDLTQDVFLRAYRGLRNFRGQSSLATWLYRIGVNVCLNRVASKVVRTETIDAQQHVDTKTESPAEGVLRTERAARVRAAVAQLPRKQRAALVLRIYHEMSHQEIADIVGSSVGAVKANVFHALQNLRKIIGEDPV